MKYKRGILKWATNGGKSACAAAVTKYLAVPTIFIVPGKDLLHQIRETFSKYLGISIEEIGIIGDDEFTIGSWITVATMQSLFSRIKKDPGLAKKWDLMWVDECHVAGAETLYYALDKLDCFYRFGLSGTPLSIVTGKQ